MMDPDAIYKSRLYGHLKCFVCKNYLSHFPIMSFTRGRNVCGLCKAPEKWTTLFHNPPLETMCQLLKFPCKHTLNGCSETFKPEHMPEHEQSCVFRSVDCIKSRFISCNWSGTLSALTEHFQTAHAGHFRKDGEFLMDLTKSSESHKFYIQNEDRILLFMAKYENEGMELTCALVDNEHQPYDSRACQLTVKSENTIMTYNFRTQSYAVKRVAVFSLQSFAKRSDRNKLICKICVSEPDERYITETEKAALMSLLKCSRCGNYAVPPIFRYDQSRDVVCSNCVQSICNTKLTVPSTYSDNFLDVVSSMMLYPCKSVNNGCTYSARLELTMEHQPLCIYQSRTCPFAKYEVCIWSGCQKDLIDHVVAIHEHLILQLEEELELSSDTKEHRLIKFSDRLFRLAYSVDECRNYKWCVQQIVEDGQKFKFEIDVLDTAKLGHKWRMKKCCLPIVEKQDVFSDPEKYCYLEGNQVYMLSQMKDHAHVVCFKVNLFVDM